MSDEQQQTFFILLIVMVVIGLVVAVGYGFMGVE